MMMNVLMNDSGFRRLLPFAWSALKICRKWRATKKMSSILTSLSKCTGIRPMSRDSRPKSSVITVIESFKISQSIFDRPKRSWDSKEQPNWQQSRKQSQNLKKKVLKWTPGFNPVWNEEMEFMLEMPEFDVIEMSVNDKDTISHDFVAASVIPVNSLRPG